MRMKEIPLTEVLVKRAGSNKFLNATGRWTKKAEAALHFPNLLSAIHACLLKGLREVELILHFDGDARDHCYLLRCE